MSEGYKESPIGMIPKSWEVLSIDKIGEITSSKRIHSADYTKTGIPFFRGKEITQLSKGESLNDIVFIKTETFNELKNKFGAPKTDDILITAVGTIGSVYLVREKDEFYFKDGNLMWIRNIIDKLNKKYLMHYLRSNIFQNLIDVVSSGSSQKALTIVKFKSLFIPVPKEIEQQKIAEILSTVDAKIEVIDQQITETQELKKGLMQRLLTKGIGHTEYKDSALGEIPKSWEVVRICEVTSYVDYRGKTPPKVNSGILLVTARNIKMGKIDYETSKEFIPKELYETVMSRGIPQIGDVLITTEAPLGNIASVDNENIALAQRVIKYRGNIDILDNCFLKQYMLGSFFQGQLEKQSSGSTVKGIKGSVLHKLEIVLPPLLEQKQIADILSSVDEKLEVLSEKKSHYQELKQGLMQQLLTGKIRVNTNDTVTA